VRALQHLVVRRQQREPLFFLIVRPGGQQALAFFLVQLEHLPQRRDVRHLEVVNRKLQLVGAPHIGIGKAWCPFDVVHAVGSLQECHQALHAVGQFGGHQVQVHTATLLEVGELRNLQAVHHHLPADAPGAERGRFPVVFLEFDVVLSQVDADGLQAAEILLDDIARRRFQNDLQLLVLVKTVGILRVTAISRTAAGLDVRHPVRLGPQHAEEGLRAHGPGADFHIVRFLNDAAAVGPVLLEF